MLLELKALGLRFLCGVLVGAVWRDADTGQSWAGYRYDSLWGHIETGAEWFVLRKHHRTGEVRLRIEAVWRAGQLPTWWSRIGFALLRPLYLRLWQRRSVRRLVASAPAAGK